MRREGREVDGPGFTEAARSRRATSLQGEGGQVVGPHFTAAARSHLARRFQGKGGEKGAGAHFAPRAPARTALS